MKLFLHYKRDMPKKAIHRCASTAIGPGNRFLAPSYFQVSRLMLKFGIFRLLSNNREGLSLEQISQKTELSRYAAQVLLEASSP